MRVGGGLLAWLNVHWGVLSESRVGVSSLTERGCPAGGGVAVRYSRKDA